MTVISQLTWVAIAPLWGFVMDRYGRKPAVLMGFLVGLTSLCYVFLTKGNYVYLLPLLSLAAGFFGPAFWEGSNQLMLTLAPRERRVVYISWYNTIIGSSRRSARSREESSATCSRASGSASARWSSAGSTWASS